MMVFYKKHFTHKRCAVGGGLINNLINSLPVELHLPGYQFCGPGTKLKERLERGEKGINPLDAACREHDIAYSQSKDINKRHVADRILSDRAWSRVKSKDSSFTERANGWLVTNAMKAKVKFGMGSTLSKPRSRKPKSKKKKSAKCKKANNNLFKTAIKNARKVLYEKKPVDIQSAIEIARKVIENSVGGKKKSLVQIPRIIPIPKIGGFLPLVPILTALGTLGGLASGGTSIAKFINDAKSAKKELEEANRHNKTMEAIAMGKGLFMKPYKKGYGLFYQSQSKNI